MNRSIAASPPHTAAIVAAFAAVYVIWGSTYLAIRVAVETLPPLLMAGVRFVIAGGLLYALVRWRGAPRPTLRNWRSATIAGAFLLLGGNGLVVWAEQTVASGPAALLVATMPFWLVMLNAFWPGGTRPGLRDLLGLVIGSLGIVLLVAPDAALAMVAKAPLKLEPIDPWGAAALVLASLSWAIGSLYARTAPSPESPWVATSTQMLCGGMLQLLVGVLLGETAQLDTDRIRWQSVAAFAYLIVLGSWVGYTCYVWLLRVVSPAKVATYAYVNPVVAVLLGWILLDEPLTATTWAAMALIVAAVVLLTTAGPRSKS